MKWYTILNLLWDTSGDMGTALEPKHIQSISLNSDNDHQVQVIKEYLKMIFSSIYTAFWWRLQRRMDQQRH